MLRLFACCSAAAFVILMLGLACLIVLLRLPSFTFDSPFSGKNGYNHTIGILLLAMCSIGPDTPAFRFLKVRVDYMHFVLGLLSINFSRDTFVD